MGIKCIQCKHQVEKAILCFDIRNSNGDHEEIALMHCERCDAFFQAFCIDDWSSNSNDYRVKRQLYSEEQALKIFLIFASCRNYKDCKCQFHMAIYNWVSVYEYRLSDQHELFEKIEKDEQYDYHLQNWNEVIAEDRKQLRNKRILKTESFIHSLKSKLF